MADDHPKRQRRFHRIERVKSQYREWPTEKLRRLAASGYLGKEGSVAAREVLNERAQAAGPPESTVTAATQDDSIDCGPHSWNVIDDGVIVRVDGGVPGDLRLTIQIDYLRKRFSEPGEYLIMVLRACTRLVFVKYDSPEPYTPEDFGELTPTVLSAAREAEICKVHCIGGTLEVAARSAEFFLDSGRVVSLAELTKVNDAYWDEWEAEGARRAEAASGLSGKQHHD
jgi:hypothetical protein